MSITVVQIVGVSVVLAASAFLQGMMGFAFGIFCVPALTLFGMPLQDSVAISAAGSLIQSAWSTVHLRRHIVWRDVLPCVVVRSLCILFGVWVLAHQLATNQALGKQIMGLGLLVCVALLALFRVRPRPRLHPAWAGVAFTSSGLISGLFGMGGAPLVLWATSHTWPNPRTRAFLITNFFLASPALIVGLWVAFGSGIAWRILAGAAFGPVVIIGTRAGLKVGRRLSERRLRLAALAILVVMGIAAIAGPWLSPRTKASASAHIAAPAR